MLKIFTRKKISDGGKSIEPPKRKYKPPKRKYNVVILDDDGHTKAEFKGCTDIDSSSSLAVQFNDEYGLYHKICGSYYEIHEEISVASLGGSAE